LGVVQQILITIIIFLILSRIEDKIRLNDGFAENILFIGMYALGIVIIWILDKGIKGILYEIKGQAKMINRQTEEMSGKGLDE